MLLMDNYSTETTVFVVAAAAAVATKNSDVAGTDAVDMWPGGHRYDCSAIGFVLSHSLCPPAPWASYRCLRHRRRRHHLSYYANLNLTKIIERDV